MAQVGTVVAVNGIAYIIKPNGQQHQIKLGDTVDPGDTIVTTRGVIVELELISGRVVQIASEETVKFTDELIFATDQTDPTEFAIDLATIQTIIKAIEEGRDVSEVLSETTAGIDGGNLTNYGFSFVELSRISELLNNFTFDFDRAFSNFNPSTQTPLGLTRPGDSAEFIQVGTGLVGDTPNSAPVASASAPAQGSEDGALLSGSLSASDADGDALTFRLLSAAPPGMVFHTDGSWTLDPSVAGAAAPVAWPRRST